MTLVRSSLYCYFMSQRKMWSCFDSRVQQRKPCPGINTCCKTASCVPAWCVRHSKPRDNLIWLQRRAFAICERGNLTEHWVIHGFVGSHFLLPLIEVATAFIFLHLRCAKIAVHCRWMRVVCISETSCWQTWSVVYTRVPYIIRTLRLRKIH